MRAVITGASSGIGLEFANILHEKGYSLTLIARRKERLEKLKEKFGCDTEIITADLSKREEALSVFSKAYTDDTEILINNAGFGLCGSFLETDLSKELEMIDTNVSALHILTKHFVCCILSRQKFSFLLGRSCEGFVQRFSICTLPSIHANPP